MDAEAIWCSDAPYTYIAQKLALGAVPETAWLQCAAAGPFECYVNGALAGRGWGSELLGRPVWERFDIGALMAAGENTVIVLAAGGERPFFVATGSIEYADGRRLQLATGVPWQVLRADAWEPPAAAGKPEIYRAPDDDLDGAWRDADPVILSPAEYPAQWAPPPTLEREAEATIAAFGEGDAGELLQAQDEFAPFGRCKCVRREAMLSPGKALALVQTRDPQRGVCLKLDFGRVLRGYPRLRLRGRAGVAVDLAFGVRADRVDSRLRYVCRDQLQEWDGVRPVSCRYVWVRFSNCEEPFEVDCVSLVERRVEASAGGSLEVDGAIDPLRPAAIRALDAVRQEVHLPSLELGAEFEGARAYALALEEFYLSGDGRPVRALLDGIGEVADPGWSAWRVLLWESLVLFNGVDARGREAALSAVHSLARPARDAAPAARVLHAAAVEAGANLGRLLGEKKTAPPTYELDEAVVNSDSMAAALALFFGLVKGAQVEQTAASIGVRAADLTEAFYATAGFWRAGMGDKARAYLRRHWGRLLERPGPTWTEKGGLRAPRVEPGPAHALGAGLLGMRPLAPGARRVGVAPDCSIERGAGSLVLGGGTIGVEWVRRAGYFSLQVEAAFEGEVEIAVPRFGQRFPTIDLNGETCWRNEKVYPNEHLRQVAATEEAVVLSLPGGSWKIETE